MCSLWICKNSLKIYYFFRFIKNILVICKYTKNFSAQQQQKRAPFYIHIFVFFTLGLKVY